MWQTKIESWVFHKHGTSQAINVMSKHQYNLIKQKDELVPIGGSEHERAEESKRVLSHVKSKKKPYSVTGMVH